LLWGLFCLYSKDFDELRQQVARRPHPSLWHPQFIDTLNPTHHGTSSKVMPSLNHLCEQLLRVYQAFSLPLLYLILRKSP
jgi:hypothetical protein